ncbi:hypothetical protein LJC32_05585 [Oscillospiraceae bacterium OttesenSCG-928-F05]|nr:hypothetical protein [Oscillospiraceae bacterium OttesenSCG-928-F05]
MKKWSADFGNDPFDDYSLTVEILYGDEDVAMIKRGVDGIEIKWYPHKNELVIPFEWFFSLLEDAKQRLDIK